MPLMLYVFFCARQGHSGTALHIYQPKPQTRDNKYDKEGRRENHTPDHTTYMYAMHAYSSMRQFQGRDIQISFRSTTKISDVCVAVFSVLINGMKSNISNVCNQRLLSSDYLPTFRHYCVYMLNNYLLTQIRHIQKRILGNNLIQFSFSFSMV